MPNETPETGVPRNTESIDANGFHLVVKCRKHKGIVDNQGCLDVID
jgi:hypothetical protein